MAKDIVSELVEKTYKELAQPEKPGSRSRVWRSTNGYIFLVPWANAALLRVLVRKFTARLPLAERRLKAQLDDAARSIIANIEEGYARPTTSQYVDFLGYSQASLKEVKGDVQRSLQDGWLRSKPGSSLASLGINLKDWHEALKRTVVSAPVEERGNHRSLGESREGHFTFLYPPVDNLMVKDLTYETMIELCNKTDWHLRRLVESLEQKMSDDRKFYQVEQARIKAKARGS